MKKLILQEFITIDSFAAGPNGELDFMPSHESKIGIDEKIDRDLFDFIDTIDTILLGRTTYQMFADFWPSSTTDKEIVADKLNATPKIVFSQTLDKAPWGKWQEAKIVKSNAAQEIKTLKQQSGKNMVLWGSISLAQSLMKEKLIDECHIFICPAVIGNGKRLFSADFSTYSMKLIDTKSYHSGVVLLRYSSD